MKNPVAAIAASLLTLTAAGASAADFPKSGSTKATGYQSMTIADALDGWETGLQPGVFVMTAVIRNETEGGPFDKNFMHCVGQEAMIAGAYKNSGTCTETDKDGDKMFISFESGTFTYLSGTAKQTNRKVITPNYLAGMVFCHCSIITALKISG